jgi:hypothetical protein
MNLRIKWIKFHDDNFFTFFYIYWYFYMHKSMIWIPFEPIKIWLFLEEYIIISHSYFFFSWVMYIIKFMKKMYIICGNNVRLISSSQLDFVAWSCDPLILMHGPMRSTVEKEGHDMMESQYYASNACENFQVNRVHYMIRTSPVRLTSGNEDEQRFWFIKY